MLKSLLNIILGLDIGRFFIEGSRSITIPPRDFIKMFSSDEECLRWQDLTINTTEKRIRITFHTFVLEEADGQLEVGDGSVYSEDTRLARFDGQTQPSDVISVSNSAWIRISSHCAIWSPEINLTISGINPGKHRIY